MFSCSSFADAERPWLIIATASAAITAGMAMAIKFCCNGNAIATSAPIRMGARMAPLRPTPDAKPMPVDLIATG